MTFLRHLYHTWTGKEDHLTIGSVSVSDLKKERKVMESKFQTKKRYFEEAKAMRERLFSKILTTDNQALRRELATEVASFETRMTHIRDDKLKLLNGMNVIDGLLALKSQEKSIKDAELLDDIERLSRYVVIRTLMDPAAVELVKSGNIEGFLKVVRGRSLPRKPASGVAKVLEDADRASGLVGRYGAEDAVKRILEKRTKRLS